ncbi:hypothetical protein CAEBREN_24671 [Caenorhabditis brenneri]|uniref:HORMA domain-containing protein n=1 Tax=Caenorhabditis brenneri TaxID=135651 RepID=G0NJ29_CAEBE|nr:hypothetical protein CAEBREN_24671 [Caenorhabditis brenneri]
MPASLGADYNESANDSNDSVDDQKWGKLFPKCVADPKNSAIFMTRAMYVAFSLILHRRGILSQEHFSKNYITEKVKCMALSFVHENARHIAEQIKNCGEAIRLGYLKEISLVIADNVDDVEAIEVYAFKFHYFKDGRVSAELTTKGDSETPTPVEKLTQLEYMGSGSVRDQLVMLARSIIYLCQKILDPLPPVYAANFRLHFTDDAPDDYKVAGFDSSSTFYTLPEDTQSATIGQLRPGYHGAVLDCASTLMNDAYQTELKLKRHIDKIADVLGYQANNTFYSTMDTSDQPDPTQTTSDAVPSESPNNTMEALANRMESTNVATPEKPKKESPKAEKKTTRRGAAIKSSPYKKTRTRK